MNNAELNLIIGLAEKASGPLKKIIDAQEAARIMTETEEAVAPRTHTVGIRVTNDELKVLQQLADQEERTISDLVRRWMRDHAKLAGISTSSPVDFRYRR